MRVRIGDLKGNASAASHLASYLRAARGVTVVDVRLITGSVVVYYDAGMLSHVDVLGLLEDRGCAIERHTAVHAKPATKLVRAIGWLVLEKAVEQSLAAAFAAIL